MASLLALVSVAHCVDVAAKSLAVMLTSALAAVLLYRASAAWRHLAWCTGVISLLLLSLLSSALPAWRVSWAPSLAEEAPRVSVAAPPAPQAIVVRPPPSDGEPSAASSVLTKADAGHATNPPQPSSTPPRVEPQSLRTPGVVWLTAAWLLGVAFALLPLVVGLCQLARLRRGSSRVRETNWLALVGDLRARLGLWRSVALWRTTRTIMPLTWGAVRPVVLLPADADGWSGERRRLVLLHELAHIRRWDWLTQMLTHLACAFYWFNPLVWIAARQMRIERERACDDLVLASGARASDYAQELLELATGLGEARLGTLAAVPMARRRVLEDRLRTILDGKRSRTALTTPAVCLVAALAAALVAPLAMLRAVQPLRSQEARAEAPPAAAPKPAQGVVAQGKGIRISVLNATGDKAIGEFRVLAGVPGGSAAEAYVKATGRPVINWQPHTVRIGKDGDCTWPLNKAYEEMAIRVEADGYVPQTISGIKAADGAKHLVFQLKEDKGLEGQVLTPQGKPAAGATIALALAQKDAVLEEGQLRGSDQPAAKTPSERWRRPAVVRADKEGRFRLPTEGEPAALLVLHEEGVRELAYDAWQKAPEITLQRWGRIEGRVLWGDKPGAGEEVSLSIYRDEYGYPGMIAGYATIQTDKDGRFVLDKVLPGRAQLSRPIKRAGSTTSHIFGPLLTHLVIKAGDPTPALIGGQGRKVIGKVVGLAAWKGVTLRLHPTAPPVGFGGGDEAWAAFGQLQKSDIGPLLFRDKLPVERDGSFVIENMLPGRYQLFVSAPGFPNYAASALVNVEAETPGQAPPLLKLDDIAVKKADNAKPPPRPNEAGKGVAKKPEAKAVRVRGKVVDDETGKPVERLIIQAGKFDPAAPAQVTWGFTEDRSDARDGSFSATVRWAEGWTARVLADGYVPQPVIAAAPPADKREVVVTIRLKRGRAVRGQVLDHAGQPVKAASVFAIGPTLLNVAGGKAWSSWGEPNDRARPVLTDDAGRFELPAGAARALAVSYPGFDAWPAPIPAEGEVVVRLPMPARVDVAFNIEGAPKDGTLFYQLLTEFRPEFEGLQSSRTLPIANGGVLSLPALPPGKYQIARQVMNRLRDVGIGAMIDREFFEIKAGETKSIRWVREEGARLRGKVVLPKDVKLSGIMVSVMGEKAKPDPFQKHEWPITHASQTTAADGTFLTERIAKGRYRLVASAYTPLTDRQRMSASGLPVPAFQVETTIDVPAAGELAVPDVELRPIKGR